MSTIPEKTRAAFLRGPFKLEVAEIPIDPLFCERSDMALVEMKACGICGSDISSYTGRNPWSLHTLGVNVPSPPNVILGHEIAGVIADVRKSTCPSRNGERVGIIAYKECGECPDCLHGDYNLCGHCYHLGHDGTWGDVTYVPGGFADYFTCWHDKLVQLPPSLSFEEATQLDGLAVSVHGCNMAHIEQGDTVLVLGTGPIGFLSAQVAMAYGARRVVTTDVFEKPLLEMQKLAKGWRGCELVTVNTRTEDLVPMMMDMTSGLGADAVLDTIGAADTVIPGLKSLKRGHQMIMYSGFEEEVTFNLSLLSGERRISSSCNNPFPDYVRAINLLDMGKVEIKSMITHRFPLSQITEAFEVAYHKEEHNSIKVVVVPD
jgi:L-iditol 2-dehydrogenase